MSVRNSTLFDETQALLLGDTCPFDVCGMPPFRASDVDLFLYGLDEKEATEKVKQIFAAVKQANPKVEVTNDAVLLSCLKQMLRYVYAVSYLPRLVL